MPRSKEKKYCSCCGVELQNKRKKMCPECEFKNLTLNEQVQQRPLILESLKENYDYVKCLECGYISTNLNRHIVTNHSMSAQEYKDKHSCQFIVCEKERNRLSEKVSGSNNPGYQHNGKLSPVSYNNTTKTKEEVDAVRNKVAKSIRTSNKIDTKLSYWLEKCDGDFEKAREEMKKRHATFSLSNCIEKYGEEEGYKKWEERNNKWTDTMDKKSDEEKLRINKASLSMNGYISKEESDLYEILHQTFPTLVSRYFLLKDSTHYYMFDIFLPEKKFLIDFKGDNWRCNPDVYGAYDKPQFPTKRFKTASEIWEYDEEKNQFAEAQGYKVMVVWEKDWKTEREATVLRCVKFLRN